MSEPESAAPVLPDHGAALPSQPDLAPLQLLASLRAAGAQRLDPARFRYLEALAQRLPGQPEAVQRVLQARLQTALNGYAERWRQVQPAPAVHRRPQRVAPKAAPASGAAAAAANGPLAQLNHYLRQARQAGLGGASPAAAPAGGMAGVGAGMRAGMGAGAEERAEMASVRRFRETWSRHRAEDQVDRAIGRGPENAGPFNSHRLIVQTLTLMRELSPDYLRRFLSHADALLWLDQVNEKYPVKRPVPAVRGPRKK